MPEIDETTLELPLLFGFAVKNKPLSSLAIDNVKLKASWPHHLVFPFEK